MTTTATPTTRPRDLLRVSDLSPERLERLLALAADMKAEPLGWRGAQAGKVLACCFSKPSTRTRISLEAAAQRLGMLPLMLRPDELQLGRGEPISDTGRVLSGYVDAIAVRTPSHLDVEELAAAATVPVINALTDKHHPCQAIADLLTIQERFGSLKGIRLAYLGDGNNVAHSLMEAAALSGMEVVVSTPYRYRPHAEIEVSSRAILQSDPYEAVRGAQVVYTGMWVSAGDDAESDERLRAFAGYQVSPAIMAAASRDAIFMHCLPANRGREVTGDVIDGSQSVVFRQAANRLPTVQAAIHTLIEGWR
jgi:ornithine carbamoyltransferase